MSSDMQQHGADMTGGDMQLDQAAATGGGVTRREALAGGSLAVGALLLSGCAPKQSTTALPKPLWGSDGGSIVYRPPTSPVHPPANMPVYSRPTTVTSPTDTMPFSGVMPRSQWARTGVARPNEIYEMNGIRRITVHHDGMPPVSLTSMRQVAGRIEQIRQSHVVGRGWADLGYHYVIDPTGRVWEGRPIRFQGAHVKDQNENNLGVLVMGNFDVQSPTSAALSTLDRFLGSQMQQYRISLGNVRTHKERASTACPGTNLQAYMIRTRSGGGSLNSIAARYGLNRG